MQKLFVQTTWKPGAWQRLEISGLQALQSGMCSLRCPRQAGRMAGLLWRGFVVSLQGLEPWPRIPSFSQDSQAWNGSRASLLSRDSLGISAEDSVSGEEWT